MGKDVADAFPVAKLVFQEVDDAIGQNLSAIIFSGEQDELNLTENTQPAIMATSIAIWRVLEQEAGIAEYCSLVAGHSLGEYSALCAAGAISLADTAKLLKIRGQSMQKAVPVGQGAMAAILGLSFADVKAITETTGCWAANDNTDGQVVISGGKSEVLKACELAKEKGAKRALELPVSAPFHCPLMQPAAEAMREALSCVKINTPKVPLIANVTAAEVTNADEIRDLLVQQVTGSVRWRESVLAMHAGGIENLIEIGYGKVLTGMTKRIVETLNGECVADVTSIEAFLA
jgi:[acyl-carrier-protein] S-malonyltransferase